MQLLLWYENLNKTEPPVKSRNLDGVLVSAILTTINKKYTTQANQPDMKNIMQFLWRLNDSKNL